MKKDGRKLDHRTLEEIRKEAVERVREGERPGAVIAAYGFHRSVIYRWMKAAVGPGKGMRVLTSSKGTGRPKKLTGIQERQIFRWINGKTPACYGFEPGLWTRQLVSDLIGYKLGIKLSLTSVGALLERLGLTQARPAPHAVRSQRMAIESWQRDIYPAIAQRIRHEKADVYFWYEHPLPGGAARGMAGTARAESGLRGMPGQQATVTAVSVSNAKGAFWLAACKGAMTGDAFLTLLKSLMKHRRKPLHLVLEDSNTRDDAAIRKFVASTEGKLTLHYLPHRLPDDEAATDRGEIGWTPLEQIGRMAPQSQRPRSEIALQRALTSPFFKAINIAEISGR